ncbi:hypothetical protein [Candidatus Palauibacter soopunensis]|uniref:hypothetical protein n=1 Tax=Candidatus Palauibacter soopunensis TaxID=3056739 RepID=UPI00238677C0|nr:hypothetical protein [Candidatus Palauibacter soopunensis]MDE2879120.1 hypothetical protein [Candidatus Palauibacter soopunensis]
MTERGESTSSIEEYLQHMCDDAGAGLEEITDRDIGEGVLEPDFRSQLIAIRIVLERNRDAEEKLTTEIRKIEADIRERGGDSWMVDHWVDTLHSSTFLDAAHSMAAVGLIAPLMESLFGRIVRYFKNEKTWKDGRRKHRGVVNAFLQIAKDIDLRGHLPDDLETTARALFEYRNKMFHGGLEWPEEDRTRFANRVDSAGWGDCFSLAHSGNEPWFFYMTRDFVERCLDTFYEIIDGVGAHERIVRD